MSWNHRVIEFVDPDDGRPWFQIHEVYYDDQGRPEAYTENPVPVYGDTIDEMRTTLERMRLALDQPVLRERDFTCTPARIDSRGER